MWKEGRGGGAQAERIERVASLYNAETGEAVHPLGQDPDKAVLTGLCRAGCHLLFHISNVHYGYKSLPHQFRRVFERRNAQKPEFYGVRRFAKRNWNRRTQRYRHTLVRV